MVRVRSLVEGASQIGRCTQLEHNFDRCFDEMFRFVQAQQAQLV